MYKLEISKIYKEDTSSCYDYIKNELEAPMAANNLKKEIKEKIKKIKENPNIRPLVQDSYLASLGFRSINVKNYVIFYTIADDNKYINIVRFLHSRRNWIKILRETIEE